MLALTVAVAVVAVVWSAGRNEPAQQDAGQRAASDVFTVNMAKAPSSLEPTRASDQPSGAWYSSLYTPLLQYAEKRIPSPGAPRDVTALTKDQTKIVGYLAESYTVTDGGKTLTFKLRPNVKFSTGRPVDAAAVKASFERVLKLGGLGVYYASAGQPEGVKLIKAYEAPDPSTFVIKLARPEELMLHMLTLSALSIVDVAEVEAQGGDKADEPNKWLGTHAAGSGPYILKEYQPGVSAVFEANPDFFGPAPRERTVRFNFISNVSTLLLQARNGAADVTWGLPLTSAKSLESDPCCKLVRFESHVTQYIALPNKVPPFDNRMFREALTYAVPYDRIIDAVAAGWATAFYGPWPPAMPGATKELIGPREFDLERAKALIARSGVQLPINVDLMISEGGFDQGEIATIVKDTWEGLGINLRVRRVPVAVYASDEGLYGDNEIPLIRQDGGFVQDAVYSLDYDVKCANGEPGFANTSDYCDDRADELIEQIHQGVTAEERQQILDEIQEIWIADSPKIQLYAQDYVEVLGSDVKHWKYLTQVGPSEIAKWGR